MPSERFAKTKLGLQIFQSIGILLAVLSLYMNYKGIRDQHDWNRRQHTFMLINDVNKQIKDIRASMINAFPDFYSDKESNKLSKQDAENLFNASFSKNLKPISGRTFSCEARGLAGHYLNILEYIAVAYNNHIVDRSMLESSLGGMIIDDYDYFENFIKCVGINRNREAWKPLKDAVLTIKKIKNDPNPKPTGKL